jgi:hypothetical protein
MEQGMRAAIVFCIFLIAPSGNAQHVYKCAKGRDVSYQSAPCDGTQALVKQWEAEPESEPEPQPSTVEPDHRQSKRRRPVANSGASRSGVRTISSISVADRRCRAAKARREARLISVGLKRTFDLLHKLDDAVHEACK